MAGSVYLRRVQAINRNLQGPNDVQRGMQVGQEIGKMFGGLSEAIKGYQKDQAANKLMTQQNISNQPGAGQTIDLGTLPGGPQPNAGGGSGGTDTSPDPDPDPTSVTYPSGGGINSDAQPTYTTEDMPDLSQAVAQTKAAQTLPAQTTGGDNWSLSGFGGGTSTGEGAFPGGSGTVGGLIGTGGVQGFELQKEAAAQKIAGQNAAISQQAAALKLADARAKASGTGPYVLDPAIKRAQLLAAQNKANPPPKTAVDKTSLATNMDTEPVEDQDQLVRTYEATHGGKGSFSSTVSALNEPDTIPDPNNPNGPPIPNPNKPVVGGNSITLSPASKKPINLSLQDAQMLAKQVNVKRIAQGQSPLAVPGQDPNLGSTRANPIPVQTKLDGATVPHGKWIKTPTGQIIQRP